MEQLDIKVKRGENALGSRAYIEASFAPCFIPICANELNTLNGFHLSLQQQGEPLVSSEQLPGTNETATSKHTHLHPTSGLGFNTYDHLIRTRFENGCSTPSSCHVRAASPGLGKGQRNCAYAMIQARASGPQRHKRSRIPDARESDRPMLLGKGRLRGGGAAAARD